MYNDYIHSVLTKPYSNQREEHSKNTIIKYKDPNYSIVKETLIDLRKNPWKINSRKITRLKTKLREWLSKRLREKNLLRNMIVGNKEIRTNKKKRKQIQERIIKNLTLITSVIELALINPRQWILLINSRQPNNHFNFNGPKYD